MGVNPHKSTQIVKQVQYINGEDIDIERWDTIVREMDGALVTNFSWYLDCVADEWDALVYGDYEILLPVPISIKAFNYKVVYQPFFLRTLQLISPKTEITPEISNNFLEALSQRFKLIHFNLDKPIDTPKNWKKINYPFQVLPLEDDFEKLYQGFSKNAKRLINKAKKEGLQVSETQSHRYIADKFYELSGEKINVITREHINRLGHLFEVSNNQEVGKSYVVTDAQGEIIAGAHFLYFKGRITYLKGFIEDGAKQSGAMHFLFYKIINQHHQRYDILDFDGSKIEGVAQFYKKFGAVDNHYYGMKLNTLPYFLKAIRFLKSSTKIS